MSGRFWLEAAAAFVLNAALVPGTVAIVRALYGYRGRRCRRWWSW